MAVVKSNLLKKLANNYPNFLRKDLSKLLDIALSEIENSLRKGERVELRDIFTLETRVQKARISRKPKTNEKIWVKERYIPKFKVSKLLIDSVNKSRLRGF